MSSKSQALLLAMVLVLTVSQSNWYCSNFDTNKVCNACYAGYFLDTGKICQLGNAYCQTFINDGTGNCASCWDNSRSGLSCGVATTTPNPYCSISSGSACTACYSGYYINPSNICVVGNPYCQSYTNDGTGNCAQCWESSHSGPTCSVTVTTTTNTYCATFNGNICSACYQGYFFNANGICTLPSGQNCATYSATGLCVSCTLGYVITAAGSCLLATPYCTSYTANGVCSACVGGYYVNPAGACAIVNQCPTLLPNNVCNSCWAGFTLNNGVCQPSSAPLDPMCSNFVNDVCQACNPGFYLNSAHVCTLGDRNCYIFRTDGSGLCATCYFGTPVGGVCQIIDPQCVAYNLYNCVSCSAGFIVGHIGICVPYIPRCYTYGANNVCTGCYPGEYLSGDVCVTIPVADPYCLVPNGSSCTTCQSGMYVRADNGRCEVANSDCATFNPNGGSCLTCNAPLHLSTGLTPVLCVLWQA